jgi:hypothetical protein
VFYWQAYRAHKSDSVYLQQQVEVFKKTDDGHWLPGKTRNAKRAVRPETILEIWPMSSLELIADDSDWKRTCKLRAKK